MESSPMEMDIGKCFPSTDQVVSVWREKYDAGELDITHFKEHWRLYVPRVLELGPNTNCLNFDFNEGLVQSVLFSPLEKFMTCNDDPNEVFRKIREMSLPPSVCGKIFKMSEPTYNCRECGTDPTCVLCVDCFNKSEHRNHRYKMSTSTGGGCCDCGDVEAWKRDPYCSRHKQEQDEANSQKEEEAAGDKGFLTDDFKARVRLTFRAVLQYAYRLLTLEYSPDLPMDLRLKKAENDPLSYLDTPDTYCTILYNDESHTFEHVISTLQKVLKVPPPVAIEYVTSIDRSGRSVVKCSTFHHCTELQSEIERITSRSGNRPLKVNVTHAHVISHQLFVLNLLNWLRGILGHSKWFRTIFAEVVQDAPDPDVLILDCIMRRDASLWKMARITWHRLIIAGMLIEYENKITLARVFTKNYGFIMKEYVQDDHDHAVSIASMAVQLYTVPSIAIYLIGNTDVLFMLLNTFTSECQPYVKNGRMEFQRNDNATAFKRANYIIFDIGYLVANLPTEWTEGLLRGFIQGMFLLIRLFSFMQGMDMVTRQVGQHMEYEPEWETAFNLEMKLVHVIENIIRWCGTDRMALIKTYRSTMKKLAEMPCDGLKSTLEIKMVGDHSASCVVYDVSSQPVSIHLPLTRFLAGLHLHLGKYGLGYDSQEFMSCKKATPVELIEPVLRTLVMVAQVHAGLWRRNGYAILHQIYFYHNSKCRSEMFDQDIVMLQLGASLIESNEFIIHVLNKFKLMNWVDPEYEKQLVKKSEEDNMRHSIAIVEEFLWLLIVIVGERYRPGVGQVTEADILRREIIHLLCIKPFSHSELTREIPEFQFHETNVEDAINEVAVLNKPKVKYGKSMYELRRQYYDQYNCFFYHFSREDQSKAEEVQRRRRKADRQLECCPPPPPPPFVEPFKIVVNLLQCDVMLHIMSTVISRALDLKTRNFSESQLQRVLHLIGYALYEEESGLYEFFNFLERSEKWQIFGMLESLQNSTRVEVHADLIKWILSKYKHVQQIANKKKRHLATAESMDVDDDEDGDDEDASFSESKDIEAAILEKERKAKMAAERRAKMMAQMCEMQKSFMKENEKFLKEVVVSDLANTEEESDEMVWQSNEDTTSREPVALGPNQTPVATTNPVHICILCQERQKALLDKPALVYCSFVQNSAVLKRGNEQHIEEYVLNAQDMYYTRSDFKSAPFVATCGHVMHLTCWKKYFNNVMAKENRRPYRLRQPASFDVDKKEFLCPLCESLCNTVIPMIPSIGTLQKENTPPCHVIPFKAWFDSVRTIADRTYEKKPNASRQGGKYEPVKRVWYNTDADQLESPSTSSSNGSNGTTTSENSGSESVSEQVADSAASVASNMEGEPEQAAGGGGGDEENSDGSEPTAMPELELAVQPANEETPDEDSEDDDDNEDDDDDDDDEDENDEDNDDEVDEDDDEEEEEDEDSAENSEQTPTVLDSFAILTREAGDGQEEESSSADVTYPCDSVCEAVYIYLKSVHNVTRYNNGYENRLGFLTCWRACSYTIHVTERVMRVDKKPILSDLPARQHDCIQSIIRASAVITRLRQRDILNSIAVRLMGLIFDRYNNSKTILDWDSFTMFICLIMSAPVIYTSSPIRIPMGHTVEYYFLKLMIAATFVQILATCSLSDSVFAHIDKETKEYGEDTECLQELYDALAGDSCPVNTAQLWQQMKTLIEPFLRCCCIFYHFLTEIPATECLKVEDGNTYENMCAYLGLPITCKELLDDPSILSYFKRWGENEVVRQHIRKPNREKYLAYLPVRTLIDLPHDYSDLINSVTNFCCPVSRHEDSRNPTLCLVCGTMVCSQSYCCQHTLYGLPVGACAFHAFSCGNNVGVFLRVRECEILLLSYPNRGCFSPPPYIDEYGETDQGLRRGNALKLCPDRYKKLNMLWLSHGVHDSVSRIIESSSGITVTQWNHL